MAFSSVAMGTLSSTSSAFFLTITSITLGFSLVFLIFTRLAKQDVMKHSPSGTTAASLGECRRG